MAIQRAWIFTENPILNATESSYKLASRITIYHMGALQSKAGDPFFDALILSYTPKHNAYQLAYDNWRSQGGEQKGQTLNVKQLLRTLSGTKIRNWDIAIQNVYAQGTPQYTALLPNRRVPFQNGTQAQRIAAVKALSIAIGADVALAVVKADVDAFAGLLDASLLVQKGAITSTKTLSDAVEEARIEMCIAQYANLGALIQKYAAAPDNINQYFDLAAIRSGNQVFYVGDTNPNEFENIVKHTFGAGDRLRLKNDGTGTLRLYLAAEKNDAPGVVFVDVLGGEEEEVPVTDLGPITNTYLNVKNLDAVSIGEWEVEFV